VTALGERSLRRYNGSRREATNGEAAALLPGTPSLQRLQAEGGGGYKRCRDCGKYRDVPDTGVPISGGGINF
jgi:hypothetical protein